MYSVIAWDGAEPADETVDGGPGFDTVDGGLCPGCFSVAVTVNLAEGLMTGFGADTLIGFEGATGGRKADTITGDDEGNHLAGGRGADQLSGLGGDDALIGGRGPDNLDGGSGDDSLGGGPEGNVNEGGEGNDHCVNPEPTGGATGCEQP